MLKERKYMTETDYKKLIKMGKSKKKMRGGGRNLQNDEDSSENQKIKLPRGVSQKLAKNIHFIGLLGSKNPNKKQKKALLDTINKTQINAIGELTGNLLNGRYNVPKSVLKKLSKDKDSLYALADKKKPISKKKKILEQKGGFLGALLPLLPLALPILKKIF